jgi:O-antigen/teichoic acid export membrane protein
MPPNVPNARRHLTDVFVNTWSTLETFRSARWALTDQIIVSGCNFLSNILLARILGIEEFGRYVLAWTIVLFVQGLQFSTVSSSMLSIGPKHDAEGARSYFGAIFIHQSIFGVVSAALTLVGCYITANFFPEARLDTIALPLTGAVLCTQTQDFFRRYFFSVARPKTSLAIDVIRYVGQNVAILGLISWFPANSVAALWLLTAAAALGLLAALPSIPRFKYSLGMIVTVGLRGWHFSKWLIASTLLFTIFNTVFSFAAGILLGTSAVGAMRAAFTLVGIANVVIEASVNVISAGASRKFMSKGRHELVAYLKKVTAFGVVALASLMAAIVIAPKYWLRLIFGPEFGAYWILVLWYAGYEILVFLALIMGTWYRTLEQTRSIFYANLASAVLSLAVSYPLIVHFGVAGAAAGLVMTQGTQVLYLLMRARLTVAR